MGRKSKSNLDLPEEEPLTVTRSGRTIIKPNPVVTNTPAKKTTKTNNKKLKESSDEEDSSENEEPIIENQKNKNKKKKDSISTSTTSTVNRKEKKTTTPKKKQQQKLKESDDEDDSSSSSSSSSPSPSVTPPQSSNTPTKKYTLEELDIITRENRIVYIKFFIFSILMVVVPLLAFKIFNTTVGDYLGISRQDRVTYAGVASLCGLILVMAAYSVMAYFEK
ncbi:hypothetical protein ACTFIY_008825 [Dictyostelium cf. discoideum]